MDASSGWAVEFERWVEPFCAAFRHKAQRRWAPLYLRGLIGPGARKSVEPLAGRVAPEDVQQLHHFVATSKWETEPLEDVLLEKADALVGGEDAHLIIDDTAIPKKGEHSVGVSHQYCGQLGKQANCQCLVSLTLARNEVPVPIALRLYLPDSWASDPVRRKKAGVPPGIVFREKWRIALEEITHVVEAGVRFGDVLADAGYGGVSDFRHGLDELGLRWAVGVQSEQRVYSADVVVRPPRQRRSSTGGRPRKHGQPSEERIKVGEAIDALGPRAFRRISWRTGTKGALSGRFAAMRVCPADGVKASGGVHLPTEERWLVCEQRTNERKYYLTNHPDGTPLKLLVAAIKARWACEQAHQQLKEELGLGHFEGRSWHGLHHHALMTMIACTFLQHLRVRENKA